MVFQLIAFRFVLHRQAITSQQTIPKTPRHRLSKEKPALGIIVLLAATGRISCAL